MPGALLDSHTLYWLVMSPGKLSDKALFAIGTNQAAGTLYASPITAWELTIASRKPPHRDPPDLGSDTPSRWFSAAIAATEAKVIPIRQRIACEAALLVEATGHRDPADCYLMATARVRRIPIISRDAVMRDCAAKGVMELIPC